MNITTNNTKYEILQADINTANNIISIDNYQGAEGSDLIISATIIFNKNSQSADANYPKNLELNTIYYLKNESNLTSFKFYHDDAATTEVVFSDSDIEDITAFTFAFIYNQNYLDTFFSGADSLEDLTCCPVDRKRTFLFLAVYVTPYFLNQIEVGDFFFRNDPSGHLSDFHFFPSGFTSGNVATAAMITIEEDPEDENKIIVHYRLHGTGGSYDFVNYYSESILKEDFPNVITVTTDENTGGNSYHADTMNLSFYRSGHVPQKALLYLNNAKFKSAEGEISIGDITEELTYDYRSNKYVSDLMNYNDVAGRLFLNVNFYPKKSTNVKYIKQNLINSYGNYGFIYGLIINRTWYENDDGSVYSIPLRIQCDSADTGFTHVGYNSLSNKNNSRISFSSGTQYQLGGGAIWLDALSTVINNDYSLASTPGLTYLAVGYAVTTAVVKSGYPNTGEVDAEYTNFDDDEFYRENLISVFSESSSSFIQSLEDVVYASPTITETNDLIIPEDPLVITGTDFDLVSSNNDIIFHVAGLKAEIISSTSTTITIEWINPPESDGYYYAIIATQYGDSGAYTKIGFLGTEPTITFNDDAIPQNADTLIIAGTGFNTTAGENLVTFNLGAVGTVTAATATELTVTFSTQPTSLGNLEVTLLMPLSAGAAVQVATVVAGIVVTPNSDSRAINAPTLVIAGTGFSATANHNTVTFNLGAVGTVTSATTTQLTITFSTQPTSTGSLTAVVAVSTSNGNSGSPVQVATIVAAPTVTENTAYFPIDDSELIISGTGFDAGTPANNLVTFNHGAVGTVTAATSTQLTVSMDTQPNQTGNFTATVNSFGGDSNTEIVGNAIDYLLSLGTVQSYLTPYTIGWEVDSSGHGTANNPFNIVATGNGDFQNEPTDALTIGLVITYESGATLNWSGTWTDRGNAEMIWQYGDRFANVNPPPTYLIIDNIAFVEYNNVGDDDSFTGSGSSAVNLPYTVGPAGTYTAEFYLLIARVNTDPTLPSIDVNLWITY